MTDVVFLVCWIVFWIYWLAASRGVKSSAHGHLGRLVGARAAFALLALALVRAGAFKGHPGSITNPVLQGVGVALLLGGLGLAVWARVCLGRNWGTPMSEKADPELITSGPYARIRHPIYSGIILGLVGTTVGVSLYWAGVVVLVGSYFVYSAFVEEGIMARRFPGSYPQYKRRTKMLVPFVL